MVTDEEVEAAARAIVETWAAEKMPGLTWAEAVQAEKEPDEFPALCTLAPLARKEARAALLAAEAARKPDVVPQPAKLIPFEFSETVAVRILSPSPEHLVDDDALVRRLDGLPQP
jgi:hypothetical protein